MTCSFASGVLLSFEADNFYDLFVRFELSSFFWFAVLFMGATEKKLKAVLNM